MTAAPAPFFQSKQWRRLEMALLLAILLLAAGLRLWRLDQLPPGFYHDEAYNGLDALSLVQGKTFPQFYEGWELYAQDAHGDNPPAPTRFPIFFEGNYGRELLHIYLMALSIWLLGPTPFAVRLVPALAGVLAVFTTYLAAKAVLGTGEIEDQRLKLKNEYVSQSLILHLSPLFAAFFMAILLPAIHFSRFGLRMMPFVVVETLVVYFFWRGVNGAKENPQSSILRQAQDRFVNRQFFVFALAGLFLGLGVYVYAAGRVLPLLFVVFVPLWFWQDKAARRLWRQVALMAGVSLLTALPLLLYFARYPYFFSFRMAYVANKGLGVVAGQPFLTWFLNVGRVIGGLFWQGETHLRHNLPGRPFLDPIQTILFLAGLVHILRQKFNPRALFLLLWLIVMLLPSILSGDAPHFGRMSGALPVVAIFLAMGLVKVGEMVNSLQFTVNNRRLLLFTVYGTLFTASLIFTFRDYFIRYANHPQLAADFYLPDWELGQLAAAQPADTMLYLTPTQEEMATIYFALADPDRLRSYSGADGAIPAGKPGQPSLYFIRPDDALSLHNLQTYFPQGSTGAAQNGFIPFAVPAAAPRTPGLTPIDAAWGDQIRLVAWSLTPNEGQLRLTLAWQALAPVDVDYTVFVHLLGADGLPLAQADRLPGGYPTGDWQPGEIVVDTFVVNLPPDLPPGTYPVQTGLYDLTTLGRLGTAVLTEIELPNEQ
ncbi:MAG: hypothetical protein R6X34_01410 [Chloroflexota bacterium]